MPTYDDSAPITPMNSNVIKYDMVCITTTETRLGTNNTKKTKLGYNGTAEIRLGNNSTTETRLGYNSTTEIRLGYNSSMKRGRATIQQNDGKKAGLQ